MSYNPYRIDTPSVISFSGGRTSGYMLYKILEAYQGVLPEDIHVIFANTGKERVETLTFIHECSIHWGINIRWIEWQRDDPRYREVDFKTARRNYETGPFDELIEWKKYLPNAVQRICTQHLKIDAMMRFIRDDLKIQEDYTSAIGIRYDEPRRWRILGQDSRNRRETKVAPLVEAKVTEADVMAFWKSQPFDLQLSQGEGNCDLCFMKGVRKRETLIRKRPDLAEWWASKEEPSAGNRRRWSAHGATYADLMERTRRQLPLFDDLDESEPDCNCTD